jgi:30S ribosomal protein S31
MGKGDKKTAKGKRTMGSYGNSRKKKTASPANKPAVKKETKSDKSEEKVKKTAAKKETTKAAAEKKPTTKKAATEKKTSK